MTQCDYAGDFVLSGSVGELAVTYGMKRAGAPEHLRIKQLLVSWASVLQWVVLGGRAADGLVVLFATGVVVVGADQPGDSRVGAELCGRNSGAKYILKET